MKVLIAGGGVAGVEALLALEALAREEVDVTLVSPVAEFVYKPLTVEEPFGPDPAATYELGPLVEGSGGRFVSGAVRMIEPEKRRAELEDGTAIDFDAAIICVGATPTSPFSRAQTLTPGGGRIEIDALLRQAAADESRRIAFVLPPAGSWPLPVYELALMTERRARELGIDVRITIVTPEEAPLFVFGPSASSAVSALLEARGIEIRTGARVREDGDGTLVLMPAGERLSAGALVALPDLRGPDIQGVPVDERGFIPIDEHARVAGASGIYAAGDGTNFPVKHGGLGSQQADAAAEHIAAEAGAAVTPSPFRPVIRGKLITGDESLNLQAEIAGGGGEGVSSLDYLWWPPQKIAGRYLSAMLTGDTPHPLELPPEHGIDVEVSLDREWHGEPMGWDAEGERR